ncbi:MAG: DUF815 domain-containing protein [Oscillospiraceae bacterium]|nr:DUF815 domain-containing protein [Oscillospiraceae bacterium]
MELVKARLAGLTVYKEMLELSAIRSILRLCDAKEPVEMMDAYTDFVREIWVSGFSNLGEYLRWHLKYDETVMGTRFAQGTVPEFMERAAVQDIQNLSAVGQLSCGDWKRYISRQAEKCGGKYDSLIEALPECPPGGSFRETEIFDSYRKSGCGIFSLGRAFHWEKGHLTAVKRSDPIRQEDMVGYDVQRNAVVENTRMLLAGNPANNVLLYGDSGTGKSATVKSLINHPDFYNLRIIEIAKNSLEELTELTRSLGRHTQKFIIYIDDLSFEREDKGFSQLKTALEGGLERRPDNVVIYATSNRRHMIRESFSDRAGDEIHAKETLEERTSLAERFGLRLAYLSLDKKHYSHMVLELCHRNHVTLSDQEILTEANRWEIQHGGRTPRIAVQLVEKLSGQERIHK